MNTVDKVIEIIARHVSSNHAIETPMTTLEALNIDSLDRVEISIELEEYFKIDLEAPTVASWTTVQDIINSVENETPLLMTPTFGAAYAERQDVAAVEAALRPNDAALKLAMSSEYGTIGKPEAINRISRDALNQFTYLNAHSGEFNSLDRYQEIAVQSAIYPGKGTPFGAMYCALGLGEAGEIQNKVKKAFRDDDMMRITADFPEDATGPRVITTRVLPITPERRAQIIKEMGGNLWYLAALADELGITLSQVAEANLAELCDRGERNTLRGDGDNR